MATSPKKKPPAKKAPAKKAPAKDLKPGDIRSQYTYKNESPQQSARDLKASDMRQKFAEGPKQSRAAADLKPGDSRSSYLKKKAAPKASSGTLTERMGEAKNRPNKGLPARTGQPQKVRGNPNMARPSKVIKQGYTPGSASRAVVPYQGAAKRGIAAAAGTLARGAAVATVLPSLIINPAFMSYKTGGEAGPGSAKPSGPLFSPSKNRAAGKGNPKAVNPYKTAAGGGPRSRQGSSSPSMAAKSVASNSYFKEVPSYKGTKAPISMAGGGVNKIDTAKDKMKRQQQGRKPDKPAAPVKRKAPAFKGNWTGAAPTEMQKRGGQKIMRPKGNLLDLIRNKKK